MDPERKQQILSAEILFAERRQLSDALADRGFYVIGPAPAVPLGSSISALPAAMQDAAQAGFHPG